MTGGEAWPGPAVFRSEIEAMSGAEPEFDVADAMARFAPEVRLHPEDSYRPASVDWYFDRVQMRLHRRLQKDVHALARGEITRQTVTMVNLQGQNAAGSTRSDFFLQIPNDGAESATREGDLESAACYVHVRPVIGDSDRFDIQYWFFHAYNGSNDWHVAHEGDWEHVTVRVSNEAEPELERIYFGAHSPGDGQWIDVGRVAFAADGAPVVYSALSSHASYPSPGSFSRPGLKPNDTTAGHGPAWRTRSELVLTAENGLPTGGNEWLAYSGHWGEVGAWWWPRHGHGPYGPPYQASWYAE